MTDVSISPDGTQYPIPKREEYAAEFNRIKALADAAHKEGKEVVKERLIRSLL